ncbi:MAG: 3-phosphoglycerate dehydrogenase [Muribaculaceae bacterium]|nr:3-phosphoglycerate dehydrogenase [Muribaculaceae bacterium]
MKILVATEKHFAPKAVEAIRAKVEEAGHTLALLEKYTERSQLEDAVADADALIVRSDKIDAALMDKAPRLKIIVRAGAGYDNIDLAAATARNIVVENTPGQNSRAVAELVLGMAIMAGRNNYDGTTGCEISGKRVGLQAFGQVSRNVAKVLEGFGAKVSAVDPFCKAEVMKEHGVEPAESIEALYAGNDIVSIHIPATPQTVGSIGRALIASMPKGAILINTARKEVINEAELAEVLEERPDLKYFADVKPDNAAELVERFGTRVFFTPKKCGAQTREANMNAGIAAADQAVSFLATGKPRFKVN